jgi:hypothetical protein
MNKDMVELDLPMHDSRDTLQVDAEADVIELRKRFDEERQQLRREITALRQQNRDREQQLMSARERDREQLYQETVKLTGELFTLRRQLQEQTKLQAECEELQAQLEAARAEAASLREELSQARPAGPARTKVRRPRRAEPVHPLLADAEAASAQAAAAAAEPAASAPEVQDAPQAEDVESPQEPSVFSTPENEQVLAPAAAPAAAPPQVVQTSHSFHRSGNPIPVLIAVNGVDEDATSGWVVERSLGGMTLMLDQEVPPGTQVRVRNARPACTRSSWTAATVKQIHPVGSSFKLVCRFVEKPRQQFW